MKRATIRRGGIAGGIGMLALLAASTPALAQSSTEKLIMGLNRDLLVLAVPIAIFMEALLLYTVFKFRNNDEAKPTTENRSLEISWTVATALVLVFVGFASYQVLGSAAIAAPPPDSPAVREDAVVVNVTGQQFLWQFEYPEENVSSTNTMVIPVNETIYMQVTSRDVIHSVHVPKLALKQDAIPGQVNTLQTTVTEEGEYQLYCAEYCGTGHSKMLATVKVVSEEEYKEWLEEQRQEDS